MDRKTWSVVLAPLLLTFSLPAMPATNPIPTVIVPAQEPIPQTQKQYRLFRGGFFHSFDL
jgi:hypothetical protein